MTFDLSAKDLLNNCDFANATRLHNNLLRISIRSRCFLCHTPAVVESTRPWICVRPPVTPVESGSGINNDRPRWYSVPAGDGRSTVERSGSDDVAWSEAVWRQFVHAEDWVVSASTTCLDCHKSNTNFNTWRGDSELREVTKKFLHSHTQIYLSNELNDLKSPKTVMILKQRVRQCCV